MKAQASNTQRALCSALHSPMKRQFVKLCDRVIRIHPPPPHTLPVSPFRLLLCQTEVAVRMCVCARACWGGGGLRNNKRGVWHSECLHRDISMADWDTQSYTLSPTLSHSGSPPHLFVHRLSVTRGSRDHSS